MSPLERQILSNQFQILAHLDPINKESFLFKSDVVRKGMTGLYSTLLPSSDETSKKICDETRRILTMFRAIKNGIDNLSKEDKENLDLVSIQFNGFDLHGEHFSFAKFLVEKTKDYDFLNGEMPNSHDSYTISVYRNMLGIYDILNEEGSTGSFSKEDLEVFISKAYR